MSQPGDMYNKFQAKKHKMKRKSFGSMENGGQPMPTITKSAQFRNTPMGAGAKARMAISKATAPKVNVSPSQGWKTASGKMLKSKKNKTKKKSIKLIPVSKGHKPKGAHGRAAVKALGRTKTTGNFARIEAAKGKGAAIAAYQNALAAHKKGKTKGKMCKMHKKMMCKSCGK